MNLEDIGVPIIESWFMYGASELKWKPATFRSHHRNFSVVFGWLKEK